jgi:hypothetical protein
MRRVARLRLFQNAEEAKCNLYWAVFFVKQAVNEFQTHLISIAGLTILSANEKHIVVVVIVIPD